MTANEIRLRQMAGQHLLHPAEKLTVIRNLSGVQAQFFSNALHSLRIRCGSRNDLNADDLVKNWTVRGTIHVLAEDDLPLHIHKNIYRLDDWSLPCFWNQRPDWTLSPERQTELSSVILSALKNGALTREELKVICRESGMTEAEEGSMFHPWGGGIRQLCEHGFMHGLAQEEKAYCLTPEFVPLPEEEAKLELARRYFTHMAPATIHDAMYYFGTTASQVKQWLSCLPVTSTECEGRTYYFIENDITSSAALPRCIFLAGFDQLMLGYEKKESLYLKPEHLRKIFNLAGIVMSAVLMDGQVVGRWKKSKKTLSVELFSPLADSERTLICETAFSLWGDEISKTDIKD